MRSFTFLRHLQEAGSVFDLARRLGAVCMDNSGELREFLEDPLLEKMADELGTHVARSDPEAWAAAIADQSKLGTVLGADLNTALERADLHYPLDCLAVLKGLCRRVLVILYEVAEDTVQLDRGSPVPFAVRPLGDGFEKTPHPETLNSNELLGGHGHRLFEFSAGESPRVVLDYSIRTRIDAITWSGENRLPRVATLHPKGCGVLRIGTRSESEFFDAEPAACDPVEIHKLLCAVGDVEIAVLPELSLSRPDALEEVLSDEPEAMPPLVVAGSAHVHDECKERSVKANEARIYLRGGRVGRHRKCHPYVALRLAGKKLEKPLIEGITQEQKAITVLSGEFTRLAVVICADLNDQYIPQKLLAAGVNTLIVPSFTPKKGSFNGPISDLASRCQAISVIANAPPEDASTPFHGMVAVPRPDPSEQSTSYPRAAEVPTRIAVFDPNEPLSSAISWR